jgi:hypothetical protein
MEKLKIRKFKIRIPANMPTLSIFGLFVWLVADGWCWFILREKYRWLAAGGLFVLR